MSWMDDGMDTVEANRALDFSDDQREYYIGAQILKDLVSKKCRIDKKKQPIATGLLFV